MTCEYKCADACFREPPNPTDNTYFGDVLSAAVSRRALLKGTAATAVAMYASRVRAAVAQEGAADSGLSFTPLEPTAADMVSTAPGYTAQVLISWGDPLFEDAPEFDFDIQSPEAQARQFGYNNDYIAYLPLGIDRRGRQHALLVVNHEFTNGELMFRGYNPTGTTETDLQHIRIEMTAVGLSVFEIRQVTGTTSYKVLRRSTYNRRITAFTPMRLSGPAAGHEWLKTSADPTGVSVVGTANNCAGGVTPWGTVLSGEENIDSLFVNSAGVTDAAKKAAYDRYGFSPDVSRGRRWHRLESRFDLSVEPNEGFRFGYIVEIDPMTPTSVPRKRTHLGRFKHENAETTLDPRGRPVVYMGDDERYEYVYKFVSSKKMRKGSSADVRRHNMSLLDEGTLYVARFAGDSPSAEIIGSGEMPSDGAFDGSGTWIPLASGDQSHVAGMSAAEVFMNTRAAADAVGATKMDRPEDLTWNSINRKVYVTLTANPSRGAPDGLPVDEANPRPNNRHGHIIEIEETNGDASATSFVWRIFMLCGEPADPSTYFAGFDKTQVSPISSPDNLTFDRGGNLWIGTDGIRTKLGFNDGIFGCPTEGPERGHLKLFLTVPVGAEATGPCLSPDQKTFFCSVQHPGEVMGATIDSPASRWPDGYQPRPSVVNVFKPRGSRRIGS